MSIAVDCISSPSNAALAAAGVSAVSRYLSWQGSRDSLGKVIGASEYNRLRAGGIGILLNWEYSATDWLGGASLGTTHGNEAVRQAKALGHPAGRAIVGSADFDMTASQWSSAGHGYAVAFANAVRAGGYTAGVYGPYDVLTWCLGTGLFSWFWQAGMSTAWSAGRNKNVWPGVHLRQVRQQTVGGVDCDVDTIYQADFGQSPDPDQEFDMIMMNGMVPPAIRNADGTYETLKAAAVVATPWDSSAITFACDFGKAKLRVAEHVVDGGWVISEFVIDSNDNNHHDLPRQSNCFARSITREPIDENDTMDTPVAWLLWF